MKKITFKVFTFILVILFLTLNLNQVKADNLEAKKTESKQEIMARQLDPKAKVLAAYLAKHNSPLQYHAQDFIDAANQYSLDWKLVAAISGTESTFGKHIPGGYNGWGWGVYGTQAISFKSWREAIFTVSEGLRLNYINKGYTDPYSMNRIYASSPAWGGHVTFFMNDIEKFAQNNHTEGITYSFIPANKEAVTSGLLAFNR